jgi:hypothetical protein
LLFDLAINEILSKIPNANPDDFIDFPLFETKLNNLLSQNIGKSVLTSAEQTIDRLPRPTRDRLSWSQYGPISGQIQSKAREQTRQISDGTRNAIILILFSQFTDRQKAYLIKRAMGLSVPSANAMMTRYRETLDAGKTEGLSEYRAEMMANEEIAEQSEKHHEWRSEIIGISAITAGFALGARDVIIGATNAGIIQRSSLMFWEDAGDGKVRASHQDVAPVRPGELFTLGSGVVTEGPGLSGVPSEDCQCRCSIALEGG